MSTGTTAPERHRANHIRPGLALGLGLGILSCSSSVPLPPQAPVDAVDYVEVSTSPRPPPVEFLPDRPRDDAVWVDGSWDWSGERFGWRAGTWAVPPKGLRRARWVIVRRKEDGQLFFAPSTWKDEAGKNVDDSRWIHALGPQARARTRIGGPAAEDDPTTTEERRGRERRAGRAAADAGSEGSGASDAGAPDEVPPDGAELR